MPSSEVPRPGSQAVAAWALPLLWEEAQRLFCVKRPVPPFAEGAVRRLPLLMTWLTPRVQAAMGSQAPDQTPVLTAWICSAEPTLEPLGEVILLLGLWPPPEQTLSHATSTHILQPFAPLLGPDTGRTSQSNPDTHFLLSVLQAVAGDTW